MAKRVSTCVLRVVAVLWVATSSPSAQQSGVALQDGEDRLKDVRELIDRGRLAEAQAAAEELFHRLEDQPSTPSLVPAGNLLVEALTRNGRGAELRTRQLAERMVAAGGRSNSETASSATSRRNLGEVLLQAGEYQLAATRLKEAVAIRERISPPDAGELAEDLDHLSRALIEIERYDEALGVSNRAAALREGARSGADAALGRTLRIRGLVLQRKADYPGARADLDRALRLTEASAPSHPDTILVMAAFGEQLSIDGDLLRARDMLARALSLATRVLRAGHPDLAAVLRSLAAISQALGDISGSRELRERALQVAERTFGPDHVAVAIQRNDLANTLLLQGDYAPARLLYERARDTYRTRLGPDHLGVTTASYNLGLLYSALGDVRDARREFQRVIDIWERTRGRDDPNVARPLTALAEALAKQGLHTEARGYFERALAIRRKAYGSDHLLVASTLSALSTTMARLGHVERARELSTEALQTFDKAGSRMVLADALVNHAGVLVESGDRLAAARAYDRALEIRLALLGPSHPLIAEGEVAYATTLAHLEHRNEAFARALHGEEIARNHSRLTLAYLSERQALDYAASRPRGLDVALSLMSNPDERRRGLNALVLGRALTLDEMASRRRLLINQSNGLDAPLWSAVVSARQRLANLVVRGPNEQTPRQYDLLVQEARSEKERAERALAERSAAFRAEQARKEGDLDEIRAALAPNAALVSFTRFGRTVPGAAAPVPSYAAFVLSPGREAPDAVILGPASAMDALIHTWRVAAASPVRERAYRIVATNLRRAIWDPVAAHLGGADRVFIVPDAALNLVSFAALPLGESRYLLEDGPVIHYLSAERDLVDAAERSRGRGHGLLAVGDPAFADGSLFGKGQKVDVSPAVTASAALRSAPARCATLQSMRFSRLPGSGNEAREVAGLWRSLRAAGGEDGSAIIGRDATEEAFKRQGPGHRILHLATHGFFLGDDCAAATAGTRAVGGIVTATGGRQSGTRAPTPQVPDNPLLLSGLVLAGANQRARAGPDEDDGILTAEEVASLNLEGVEWTVLSACDTGLGQLRAGEGVFGLRRAFQVAGARTIIMSLWPVEDRSAREWMRALYEARLERNLDTPDSVRAAGLSVLHDRRKSGRSTHPFFWAGLVAAGDWR